VRILFTEASWDVVAELPACAANGRDTCSRSLEGTIMGRPGRGLTLLVIVLSLLFDEAERSLSIPLEVVDTVGPKTSVVCAEGDGCHPLEAM
jgi:hypothetical protein